MILLFTFLKIPYQIKCDFIFVETIILFQSFIFANNIGQLNHFNNKNPKKTTKAPSILILK